MEKLSNSSRKKLSKFYRRVMVKLSVEFVIEKNIKKINKESVIVKIEVAMCYRKIKLIKNFD